MPLEEDESSARLGEGRVRFLVEQAPVAVAMFDREMRFIAASRRWMEAYGPSAPLRWECRPWYDTAGAIAGLLITAENVTPRVPPQQALRASEENARQQMVELAAISSTTPLGSTLDAIAVSVQETAARVNAEARVELVQEAAGAGFFDWDIRTGEVQLTGILRRIAAADRATGRTNMAEWQRHVHPDDHVRVIAAFEQAFAERRPELSYEFRIIDLGEAELWLHGHARIEYDAAGVPLRCAGMDYDVTARKRAEEQLRHARQRADFLAWAVENSSQPFGAGAPDGRLVLFNKAFVELTGYTEDELRAATWATDLTPPEWRAHESRFIAELHRTGEPQLYEKEYRRKDGSRVPIEVRVHLTRGADGGDLYYAFVTDLTARKRDERRRAFLFDLGERLRDLPTWAEVTDTAARAIGEYLGVAQVGYGDTGPDGAQVIVERDWNDGRIPSVVGTWRMDDFGPALIQDMKAGQTAAIPDVTRDPRTSAQLALELADPPGLEARLLVAAPAELGLGPAQHRLAPVVQRRTVQPSLAQEAAELLLRQTLGIQHHRQLLLGRPVLRPAAGFIHRWGLLLRHGTFLGLGCAPPPV